MTIPCRPASEVLRDETTFKMIPVKSALIKREAIESSDNPVGNLDNAGMGVGKEGRLSRVQR